MLALLGICAVALVLRVAYSIEHELVDLGGDAYYYHQAANLLADGEGFVHPLYLDDGVRMPGADHPPGYQVVLALPSLLGFDSVRDHQIFSSLLGTVTVGLAGIAGRQIAGRRAGLIAAGLMAVYPNVWLNDAAIMSETLALLMGVVVVIAAYAAWRRPDLRRFALAGLAVGLATLARAEAAMLAVLVLVPLAVWVRGLDGWRPRLGRLALAGGVAGAVVSAWVVPNLFRFEEPATFSTQLGPTLIVANCDRTYSGPALGSWAYGCAISAEAEAPDPLDEGVDRSVVDSYLTDEALTYMGDNLDRLPTVVAARLGRAWGLYDPLGQVRFDRFAENRPLAVSQVGLGMYYVVAAGAVAGTVVLRRRGVPSFPVVAGVVSVAVTVVVFYGSTRFRAPAEPALVLLAAVAADALVRRRRPEDRAGATSPDGSSGSVPDDASATA